MSTPPLVLRPLAVLVLAALSAASAAAQPQPFLGFPPTISLTELPAVVGLRLEGVVGTVPRATTSYVAFMEGGEPGLDAYDAYELGPLTDTYLQLYAVLGPEGGPAEGTALDITALPRALTDPYEVTLGARAVATSVPVAADVVLSWPELRDLPADWVARLEDRETGTVVDLRTASSYAFTLPAAGVLAPEGAPPANAGPLAAPPAPEPLAVGGAPPPRLVLVVGPGVVTGTGEGAPDALALAVAPNPAAATAAVRYALPAAGGVRVAVYDVLGREVAVLADGEQAAGRHEVRLDAAHLPSGSYLVRLRTGASVLVRSLTVAR